MKKIGFIGVGIMGGPMVCNLLKAGFDVHIYARHKEKQQVQDVVAQGAVFHEEKKDVIHGMDAVLTMVGYPSDVREIYFGGDGILETADPGTYVIDMTTSSPDLAVEIYEEAKKRGLHALDAPVTGGDAGAKAGTLSILAGGEQGDFESCLPLFQAMGKTIVHEGPAGMGQHTKMANQIMIAGTLSGVCEAVAYAKAKGLDCGKLLESVLGGAAASRQLELLGPKILAGDYEPGFFIKHFIKDMKLALEGANKEGLQLDVLQEVLNHYLLLSAQGYGEEGTQALIRYYMEQDS